MRFKYRIRISNQIKEENNLRNYTREKENCNLKYNIML